MTDENSVTIHLLIVTPEEILVDATAFWVQVPVADGMLGIWPEHDALISSVEQGEVSYSAVDGEHSLPVVRGTLRVGHGSCAVLISEMASSEPAAMFVLKDDQLDAFEEQLEQLQILPKPEGEEVS